MPARTGARVRPDPEAPCPADDELAAFVEHALPRVRRLEVEAHIHRCEACRAAIGHVTAVVEDGPQTIDRYRLDRRIGEGGMGVVWEAWDPALERPIAIKLVQPVLADDVGHERALREARALARLQHPNVVAVHDVGEHDGGVFIATELVDGESLDRWQRGRPPGEVVAAYAQAARGLAAAHALGLVHRDVKPANIFVARDGRVRVGDFGLATTAPLHAGFAEPVDARIAVRTTRPKLTADGEQVGTPAYMAPEQQRSATVDARADQYSLCRALAEALLGRVPGPAEDATALGASGIPAPWAAIARGLAARPADRFADLVPLIAALEAPVMPTAASPARRRTSRWVALAVAIVVGGAAVGYAIVAGQDPPAAAPR